MPQFLSPEAQSLLRALFKRNPCNRLGEPRARAVGGHTGTPALLSGSLTAEGPGWGVGMLSRTVPAQRHVGSHGVQESLLHTGWWHFCQPV